MQAPTHIDHVGIAVRNLEASIAQYERLLGVRCRAVEEVPDQRVRTAFFSVGESRIELLESTSSDGPVAKFIEKRGEGIHHIAYAVGNLPVALHDLDRDGLRLIDREPRKGAEGLDIAFVHPGSACGVLTEFCSRPVEPHSGTAAAHD